jgi:hypothetical protein
MKWSSVPFVWVPLGLVSGFRFEPTTWLHGLLVTVLAWLLLEKFMVRRR